jgi:hypothetical protein
VILILNIIEFIIIDIDSQCQFKNGIFQFFICIASGRKAAPQRDAASMDLAGFQPAKCTVFFTGKNRLLLALSYRHHAIIFTLLKKFIHTKKNAAANTAPPG